MKTAECEGIEPVGEHFASVIAARIISTAPLPKGKNKLVVADIGGGKQINVVCGAGNAQPGLLAPWVPPGTKLGEKLIGRATIEGVTSEGMLASAAELGISRDHAGLLELGLRELAAALSGDLERDVVGAGGEHACVWPARVAESPLTWPAVSIT